MAKRKTKQVEDKAADVVPVTHKQDAPAPAAYVDEVTIGPKPPSVPGAPRPPAMSLERSMIWIYGQTKIGKTTFASQFPGPWFWAPETGQDFVYTREPTVIHSWEHFLEMCAFVEDTKPVRFGDGERITHIVIDTVDMLYRLCTDDVCRTLGIEDPSELGHGKAWARLNSEWERVIGKIRRWPFGLVAISHEKMRVFKTKGRETNRLTPEIGAGGYRSLSAAADLILHAAVEEYVEKDDKGTVIDIKERNVLHCHPSSAYDAGGRMAHLLPPTLPLSYDALNKALKEGFKHG